jgi:HTH-type transcriptional regulator/antitoxin HigA
MATTDIPQPPGEMIRRLLKLRGWTQEELALITGRSLKAINDVVRGRSGISTEMATCLAAAFGNTPTEWLIAETNYRLSLLEPDTRDIERRARLFSRGPIPEMQRRGWIRNTDDIEELQNEISLFFGKTQVFPIAARRTLTQSTLTRPETAWCFRARQMGATLLLKAPYNEKRITGLRNRLRELAAHPKGAKHLFPLLLEHGIRLVIIEPLAGVKIDGAAFWDEMGPIMALSLRQDRIDGLWFTVMHELSHIAHADPNTVDSELIDAEEGALVSLAPSEIEERADREAATSLIATEEINSFIDRVGPFYSKDRIVQFANRIRVHPGIIIGQLQHRKQIGYFAQREHLVKVRSIVVSTALTDGWGHVISPLVRS